MSNKDDMKEKQNRIAELKAELKKEFAAEIDAKRAVRMKNWPWYKTMMIAIGSCIGLFIVACIIAANVTDETDRMNQYAKSVGATHRLKEKINCQNRVLNIASYINGHLECSSPVDS